MFQDDPFTTAKEMIRIQKNRDFMRRLRWLTIVIGLTPSSAWAKKPDTAANRDVLGYVHRVCNELRRWPRSPTNIADHLGMKWSPDEDTPNRAFEFKWPRSLFNKVLMFDLPDRDIHQDADEWAMKVAGHPVSIWWSVQLWLPADGLRFGDLVRMVSAAPVLIDRHDEDLWDRDFMFSWAMPGRGKARCFVLGVIRRQSGRPLRDAAVAGFSAVTILPYEEYAYTKGDPKSGLFSPVTPAALDASTPPDKSPQTPDTDRDGGDKAQP